MIVVTGGAGFIGSCYVKKLNEEGVTDILVVDALETDEKWKNLRGKVFADYCEKDEFMARLDLGELPQISEMYHIGACSATTESDASYLVENNYQYSKILAEYAFEHDIYFMYASSAATYGAGERGYSDDEGALEGLCPLNMYGFSKHMFDLWLLRSGHLKDVVGLKYFNVFGPNEYHKGDMKSLVCKAYQQISETGKLRLFKSYKPEYGDGEQKRDFVYVKDVVDLMFSLSQKRDVRGLFNVGTGKARTWNDLANAIFAAMNKKPCIEYIDMPEVLKDKYQYFTEATMDTIKTMGIPFSPASLEESVADYVKNYLAHDNAHY